jgi:hypothetical protein
VDSQQDLFVATLKSAEKSLEGIDVKLRALQSERQGLEKIISAINEWLSAPGSEPETQIVEPPAQSKHREPVIDQPVVLNLPERNHKAWFWAKSAFEAVRTPLSVPQIDGWLRNQSIEIPRPTIRMAMDRRPDLFYAVDTGFYALVAWRSAETPARSQQREGFSLQ